MSGSDRDSPDVRPLLTNSEVRTAQIRHVSPQATAGQGFPAPPNMTERMLQDQAEHLVGKGVVYVTAKDGPNPVWKTYAATLRRRTNQEVQEAGGPPFKVVLSEAFNYLPLVEPHDGPERAYIFPCPGWVYRRIVEASVHVTEIGQAETQRLETSLQQMQEQVRAAEAKAAEAAQRAARFEAAAFAGQPSTFSPLVPQPLDNRPSHVAAVPQAQHPFADLHTDLPSDVRAWAETISAYGAESVISKVECRFVAAGSPPNAEIRFVFRLFTAWILSCEIQPGWDSNAHQVCLGNCIWAVLRALGSTKEQKIPLFSILLSLEKSLQTQQDPIVAQATAAARAAHASQRRGGKGGKGAKGWYKGAGQASGKGPAPFVPSPR